MESNIQRLEFDNHIPLTANVRAFCPHEGLPSLKQLQERTLQLLRIARFFSSQTIDKVERLLFSRHTQ